MNKGYVTISITGKNPSLFFKRFILNNIKYDKFKQLNRNTIIVKISYDDYLLLESKNTIYDIKIIRSYGFIKYVNFFKSNFSFIISFVLSIIFLLLISNLCFQIEVVHNDKEIRDLIKNELSSLGVKKLSLIPNYENRKKIINKIINNNKNEIEWLEIERLGSKLVVKVTERKINPDEENLENRHIVAKKSGIIKKIEASNGEIQKKVNDYVTKGDIIISGNIIKDDTIKGQVVAKGVVYAETWYNVKVEYPLYYKEIKYLNEIKNNFIVTFFNKSFSLKKNYTESYLENKKVLIKDKVFPFELSIEKQRKTKVINQRLTSEQALKKAEDLAMKKINSSLSKDEYIINKKALNYSVDDSKIMVDVFFKVYENITDYVKVEDIPEDTQNSE